MSMIDESSGYYIKDGFIWKHIPGEYRLSGGFNVGADPKEIKQCEATPENIIKYQLGHPTECGEDQFGQQIFIGSKVIFNAIYWPNFREQLGKGTIVKDSNLYVYIKPDDGGFTERSEKELLKKLKINVANIAYL